MAESPQPQYFILARDNASKRYARDLCAAASLSDDHITDQVPNVCWHLLVEVEALTLHAPYASQVVSPPLKISFLSPQLHYRLQHGGGVKQALAKAIGIKTASRPRVLDATAGLGRDAFIMASLGCEVTMYERHPLLFILLHHALNEAQLSENTNIQSIAQRMRLIHGDILEGNPEKFEPYDVVYLDPMFPEPRKNAKVKKEMQALQSLVQQDQDADALLNAAMQIATTRVAVKRPKTAPFLNNSKPSHQLIGKSNRFDVYSVINTI
jgi:16S rRNA (guanine1516-N2)-methyltransferase